jgi:hypothetical protein
MTSKIWIGVATLALAVVSGATQAYANDEVPETQTDRPTDRLGLMAGVNIASNTTNLAVDTSTKTLFTGGLLYELPLAHTFSLQPEFRYINKSTGTISLGYLTFSVVLLVNIPTNNSIITPHLVFGPDYGIKVSGPVGNAGDDFALDLGGGLDFALQKTLGFFLDARYSLGLTNVVSSSILTINTRGAHILAGLKFAL